MNDIEAKEFLRLQQTAIEKVIETKEQNVWRTAAATCRYIDSSGGSPVYYIRLSSSPEPSVATPSSLGNLDEFDFIVKKLNAGATVQGDPVVLHYAGNLNNAYFLGTGGSGSSAHTHSPSDLTSAVPISKGGTGATTAAAALTNLGAATASHTHTAAAVGAIPSASLNAVNGVAGLDSNGKNRAEQASAYVATASRSFTLVDYHAGMFIRTYSTSAISITVPENASVPFSIGTEIEICRYNTGTVTIVPVNTNVTIYSINQIKTISDVYGCVCLKKVSENIWLLSGALG